MNRARFAAISALGLLIVFACSPREADHADTSSELRDANVPQLDAERPPSSDTRSVGPSGGVLEANGVRLEIPPGALLGDRALTMAIEREGTDLVIVVTPDVDFQRLATVSFPADTFAPGAPLEVMRTTDAEEVLIAVPTETAGRLAYPTSGFSKHRVTDCPAGSGRLLADGCAAAWRLCDRTPARARSQVEQRFDVATLRAIRAHVGRQPSGKVSDDVGATCLKSVESVFTDPNQPAFRRYDLATKYTGSRLPNEAVLVADELVEPLKKLDGLYRRSEARTTQGKPLRLRVTGGFDSTGLVHSHTFVDAEVGASDGHAYGAAVDLGVCVPEGCDACGENCKTCTPLSPPPAEALASIAALSVEAGFDWVFYEDRSHIHASKVAPSCGSLGPQPPVRPKCTPPVRPRNCFDEELACCRANLDAPASSSCPTGPTTTKSGCASVVECINRLKVNPPRGCNSTESLCNCGAPTWFPLTRALTLCQTDGAVDLGAKPVCP